MITKDDFDKEEVDWYRTVQDITPNDPSGDLLLTWQVFRYQFLRKLMSLGGTLSTPTPITKDDIDAAVDDQLEKLLGVKRPSENV